MDEWIGWAVNLNEGSRAVGVFCEPTAKTDTILIWIQAMLYWLGSRYS